MIRTISRKRCTQVSSNRYAPGRKSYPSLIIQDPRGIAEVCSSLYRTHGVLLGSHIENLETARSAPRPWRGKIYEVYGMKDLELPNSKHFLNACEGLITIINQDEL